MSEVGFPLIGAAVVLLVVLPLVGAATKLALVTLERMDGRGALGAVSLRYALITGASALPLAWFVSAGAHQAESGRSLLACLFDHGATSRCVEPAVFALLLLAAVVMAGVRAARRRGEAVRPSASAPATLEARVDRLLQAEPALASLAGRVAFTDRPDFAMGTRGLARPRVIVGTTFASHLSDDALAAALAHELEHVRAGDPLRYFLIDLALAVNPLGRASLGPHAARWQAAREAQCDREAVLRGAAPLSLADAIVRAARPATGPLVPLGARDTAVLQLRVGMLMAFAERPPVRRERSRAATSLVFALVVGALLLPHRTSTETLDVLHTGAEHVLALFLG